MINSNFFWHPQNLQSCYLYLAELGSFIWVKMHCAQSLYYLVTLLLAFGFALSCLSKRLVVCVPSNPQLLPMVRVWLDYRNRSELWMRIYASFTRLPLPSFHSKKKPASRVQPDRMYSQVFCQHGNKAAVLALVLPSFGSFSTGASPLIS